MNTNVIVNPRALGLDQVRALAPAAFAEKPHSRLTERYQFIPTGEVIQALMDNGAVPTFVAQRKSRTEEGLITAKHLLRFDISGIVGTTNTTDIPEIVLLNSHNGLSSYRFSLGVFRTICMNGLVVSSHEAADVRMCHKGNGLKEEVTKIVDTMVGYSKTVYANIDRMKNKQLSPIEKMLLVSECAKIRWKEEGVVEAKDLVAVRRPDDDGNDLWTVMNVVQENIIRAGFTGRNAQNPTKFRRIREIKNVDLMLDYNKKIWETAEKYL